MEFATIVSLFWVLYLVGYYIYKQFIYEYSFNKLILFKIPKKTNPSRIKKIPAKEFDIIKIYSHEYDQKFGLYFSSPLRMPGMLNEIENIYPTMLAENINFDSLYSEIMLIRNGIKVWEMYLHEADGLVIQE